LILFPFDHNNEERRKMSFEDARYVQKSVLVSDLIQSSLVVSYAKAFFLLLSVVSEENVRHNEISFLRYG
jgi:hypothetical protein